MLDGRGKMRATPRTIGMPDWIVDEITITTRCEDGGEKAKISVGRSHASRQGDVKGRKFLSVGGFLGIVTSLLLSCAAWLTPRLAWFRGS